MTDISIHHNATDARYEARSDTTLVAVLEYVERADGTRDFVRTFTEDEWTGKGIAGQLTTAAFDEALATHTRVASSCSYVTRFMDKNPQYSDICA